jgi:hypothetical protein
MSIIERVSDAAVSSRRLQMLLLISGIAFLSFFLYVSVSTELDIADRGQDYYNAYKFSTGQIMNVDFHTLQPATVLFQGLFFRIFPNLDYFGLRMIGLIYLLFTLLFINILLARVRSILGLPMYGLFLVNLSLLFVPFYVSNWSLDLTYDTMPVLLTALIFYLLLRKDTRLSNFLIGFLMAFAALIKVTFLLMIPGVMVYGAVTRNRGPVKKGPWVALLGGAALPFAGFGTYWLLNHALVPTVKMYHFALMDRDFGNRYEAVFGNLLWIMPGVLFVWLIWRLFFNKKLGWLYSFAAWQAYFFFLFLTGHNLVTRFMLSYAVGTFCLGTLLFIQTRLKDRGLKAWLILLLIVIGFIFPLGSGNISLPLIFASLLLIPLSAVFLLHWNKKSVFVFAVLPFLLVPLAVQTRSRLGDFVKHGLIRRDGLYAQYSDPKLRFICDPRSRVAELEETARKIREFLPEKGYFLLYPRFPIYYWLVDNAVAAMPKVDLETAFSSEWVNYNLDYMVAKNHIPGHIFEEIESSKDPVYDRLREFIRENYRLIEKFKGFNIYELREESRFFHGAEQK